MFSTRAEPEEAASRRLGSGTLLGVQRRREATVMTPVRVTSRALTLATLYGGTEDGESGTNPRTPRDVSPEGDTPDP